MKILLFIVLIGWLAGPVAGQKPPAPPFDKLTHRVSYSAVVPLAGVSQPELLARAQAWAGAITAANQPPVISREADTELLIVTGSQLFDEHDKMPPTTVLLQYTAKIWLRAGRYRYELTDFIFVYPASGRYPVTRIPAEDYYNGRVMPIGESGAARHDMLHQRFAAATADLVASLQKGMSKQKVEIKAK